MRWKQLLAYITGPVDQELLPRNEYLVTQNRLLHQQIHGRMRLSDSDRKTLAAIGKKLGKQAPEEVATIVKPDTILAWHWYQGSSCGGDDPTSRSAEELLALVDFAHQRTIEKLEAQAALDRLRTALSGVLSEA